MAEGDAHELDINEVYNLFHGEVEEQPGDVMEEQTAEAGDVEQAGNVEQDVEEYIGGMEYAGDVEQAGDVWEQVGQETFTVTPSAIALWDYAQEIVQDNIENAQTHPHAPCPAHPPIQMSCRDKCLLALMVEDRREAVLRLWQELNEMERLLGLEHI
ncbi:uncharacterized protein HD556DRAFT_1304138 [Suillus plorans]|uniref:Uncharacterized protein n=1 Tax=Suillus plorans TaxID=116603 RepID=A0A9P7DTP4_9AGAM|nr:uncharacterized protein HD556DRAFT_1304138 [Suillus plorans]KAG1802898.1 hypothetical protein HD556DRAFT_1304138 [Suillus plorans]